MSKLTQLFKNRWMLFAVGILGSALIILGIRYVTYAPEEAVHYHANFAVYTNGQQEQFKGAQYYEETEASMCTLEPVASPNERAHMHDNVNNVVHVEDHLVTWGNFMQNLHFGMGDDYIKTADGLYVNNEEAMMHFILNGEKVNSITDKIIGDKDKLLISYGNITDAGLQKQYASIPASAEQYDTSQDPASCSGHKSITAFDRLEHLF